MARVRRIRWRRTITASSERQRVDDSRDRVLYSVSGDEGRGVAEERRHRDTWGTITKVAGAVVAVAGAVTAILQLTGGGGDEDAASARDTPAITAPDITAENDPGREAFELCGGLIRPDAVLTLSRTSGPPGTQLTISGSGFAANEQVDLRLHTTRLRTVRADAGGTFSSIPIEIPSDWQIKGQYSVVASGRTCHNSVDEPFQVT